MNNNSRPPEHRGQNRISPNAVTRENAINAEKRRLEAIKRRKQQKQLRDKIAAIGTFSVIGFILCFIAIAVWMRLDFSKQQVDNSLPLKLTLSEDDTIVLPENNYFFRNGEYYISVTALADKAGFTLHGNAVNSITLTIDENAPITFDIGTPNVMCGSSWCVMSNRSYFEREQFFIPVSFFDSFFDGVDTEYNKTGGQKGFNLIFGEGFSLTHTRDEGTLPLSYDVITERNATAAPKFVSDLSAYEMYMNPEDRDEYLFLVNESHPLSSSYIPDDLEGVVNTRGDRAQQKLRLYAAKSMEAMFIEMRAHGYTDVSVTSAYRSYAYQSQLFEGRVQALIGSLGEEGARNKVKQGTAVPGTSEHQSGLCADLHNLPAASEAFAAQDAYRWLYANCAEFGFILRYPKNKTDITGIMFEPWHYRFVGRYHARKIMDSGMCLEEYMESL